MMLLLQAAVAAAPVIAHHTVDFSPITDPLIQLLGVVVTGVATAALYRLWAWMGLKQDDSVRAYVQQAGASAGAIAVHAAQNASDKFATKVDVHTAAIEIGANYLIQNVPDGLQAMGLTDTKGVPTDKTRLFVAAQMAKVLATPAASSPVTIPASADSTVTVKVDPPEAGSSDLKKGKA